MKGSKFTLQHFRTFWEDQKITRNIFWRLDADPIGRLSSRPVAVSECVVSVFSVLTPRPPKLVHPLKHTPHSLSLFHLWDGEKEGCDPPPSLARTPPSPGRAASGGGEWALLQSGRVLAKTRATVQILLKLFRE